MTIFTMFEKLLIFLFYILILALPLANRDLYKILHPQIFPSRGILVVMLGLGVFIIIKQLIRSRGTFLKRVIKLFKSDLVFLTLVALFLIRAVSIINSKNLVNSLNLLAFFASIIGLYLLMRYIYQKNKDLILRTYFFHFLTVLVVAFFGLIQYLLHLKKIYLPGVLVGGDYVRIPATFYDANHLSPYLLTVLPFVLVLGFLVGKIDLSFFASLTRFQPKTFFQKILPNLTKMLRSRFLRLCVALFLFFILTITLGVTFSRSGFVGYFVAISVFCFLLFLSGWTKKLIPIFGILAVILILIFASHKTPKSFIDRFLSVLDPREKSSFAHSLLLRGEWELFKQFPILGVGYGGFSEYFRESDFGKQHLHFDPTEDIHLPTHSIWLETLAETGLIGFSTYLVLMIFVGQSLWKAYQKESEERFRLITSAFFASFFGLLSAGIFYSYNLIFFWFFIFLALFYARWRIKINRGQKSLVLKNKSQAIDFLFLIFFFVIFIFYFRNLIPRMVFDIPGDDGSGLNFIWFIWWMLYSVIHLKVSPFVTDYIFHPQQINLFLHYKGLITSLVLFRLQDYLGLILSINLYIIFSLVFLGWGIYLLGKMMTDKRVLGVVSGLIFSVGLTFFLHSSASYFEASYFVFLPYVLIFLVRFLKNQKRLDFLIGLFFLALLILNNYASLSLINLAMITLLIVSLLIVWIFPRIKQINLKIILTIIIALPFVYRLLPTAWYLFSKSEVSNERNKAPVYKVEIPSIYYGMGAIGGKYAFLSLPLGWSNGKYKYGYPDTYPIQFFQTVHGKKIVAGDVQGISKKIIDYYCDFPIISFFLDPVANENLIVNYSPTDLKHALNRLGVSYVLIHKDYYDDKTLNKLKFYLKKTDFGSPFYEDERFKVYSFIERIKEET